jgi:two-component system, OmpR family, alkaline phosphatase synthesis response regulator PhoP
MKIKIAVIEDNQMNIDLIRYQLEVESFEVFIEKTGKAGMEMIKNQEPDLILLDVGLPDIDGFEVCKNLRSYEITKDYPIIMLTARAEDSDRIEALKLGADDYITKPYNAEELILRIRNLLKRTEKYKENGSILKLKDMSIDFNKREVQINKQIIGLTFSEYQILTILVENLGNVVHKKEINKRIFNISEDVDSRTVDTHIHSLRKKINSSGCLINTIRSVGFVIETG